MTSRGRPYVIEHCWLRRTAPCSDPATVGDRRRHVQATEPGLLAPHNPWGTGDDSARVFDDATAKP